MAGYTNYNSNHRLHAFVRVDGSGRVISSSVVLRKTMPKTGRWMALQTYLCCNPPTTTTTTTVAP